MTRHLKRRLLERAAEIIGNNDQLSSLLDVDRHALELWLSGRPWTAAASRASRSP